jgi:hypothetical protein
LVKPFALLISLALLATLASTVRPDAAHAQASLGSTSAFTSSLITPTGRTNITTEAVAKINAASRRPIAVTPEPVVVRPDTMWVPDRYVPIPGAQGGLVLVPGHWERRISDREVYVPPLPIANPAGGSQTIPAGVHPPADQRLSP